MTSFDLLNLIGKANDSYILDARKRPKKPNSWWPKVLAAVLALVVIGSGAKYLTSGFGGSTADTAENGWAATSAAAEAPEAQAEEAAPAEPEEAPAEAETATATEGSAGGNYVELLAMASYPEYSSIENYEYHRDVWKNNQVTDATELAVNTFSYKTAAAVLSGSEKSECFSPLSLYHTLAVLCSGAEGETQSQILSLLGMSDMETLKSEIGKLYRLNYEDDEINTLKISNSLWLDDQLNDGTTMEYSTDWLMTAAADFYAEVYAADFSQAETGQALGDWISQKTGGFLEPSGEEMGLTDETVMAIVNTLWYKTQWNSPFQSEENTTDAFTLSDGTTVDCEFMHKTETMHSAIVTEEYTKSYIPLYNGKMIFVLPQEGVDIQSLLTEEKLTEIFENGNYETADVIWSVPKFETNANYDLNGALESLGITNAFDRLAADFSPMSTSAPLYLDFVRQGTRIAINEEGVEAASWNIAGMAAGEGMPEEVTRVEMNLNRPFLYLITASDGSNLFIGVVQNPQE